MNGTAFAGIDEALEAIDGLGELASHEVQVAALTAVGKPIAEDIQQRLSEHRLSGDTQGDIAVAESKEAQAAGDVVVLVGARDRGWILRWLEFGTFRQRATPVIRPAWDAARGGYAQKLLGEYRKKYKSIIAKYSRRKAA
jgi:HK97 gp10 family phage protein